MRLRNSRYLLIIALAIALLCVAVFATTNSNNKTPASSIATETPSVETATPSNYKIIGASVEGRKIEAYTFGRGPTHLMFVGGMHGGYEWNSVLLAYQFIDYLTANPNTIPGNITVSIIPSANPDGVFKVIGKEGRFSISDVPNTTTLPDGTGRFNAHNVDLNRNFACNWKPTSTWKSNVVSAGTSAFSEPEAQAIRNYVQDFSPVGAIFWHSKSNAVYASACNAGTLPATLNIMNAYAQAAGYPAVKSFDAYPISGDAEGWLASLNIPAITVELKTHEDIEWDRNLAGFKALLNYYRSRTN